ncbi:MAG: DUF4136 domain-containing protein [Adhaeribacter sp.]
MKKYAIIFPILLLLLASCSPSINVSSDYDIATNFREFKTFGWYQDKVKGKARPDSAGYDTFFDKRMKKAIETQLKSQGLSYSASNPDVYVNYQAGFSNESRVRNNYPYGYGYWGYPFGGTSVQQYKEGTITIDLVDVQKNELLWRGIGEMEVNTRNISEEKVYDAVNHIMREYPPQRR